MPSVRIRTGTAGREETIQMLMKATGESTKSKALMAAAEHYLEDKRNKERLVPQLDPETAEALSTGELPVSVTVETQVGHEQE